MSVMGSAALTSGEKGAINFIKAFIGIFSFVLSITSLLFGTFTVSESRGGV